VFILTSALLLAPQPSALFAPCCPLPCGAFLLPPILKVICENVHGRSLYVCAQFRYVPEQPRQLFRLFVLAEIMMVGRLVMMVGGGVMMSGGLMMVLTGRMFR
jgi:hypothetical protein